MCWSTPSATFFAIPFEPPVSDYICALENLTFPDSEQVKVVDLVCATIRASVRVRDYINEIVESPNSIESVLCTVRATPMRMAVTGGSTKLMWNIYATPPSPIPSRHREWRRLVMTLTFRTALNGAGAPRKLEGRCNGCKSLDHPTGKCPFPLLSDWNKSGGVSSGSSLAVQDQRQSQSQDRGKGPRGKQKGRSGRGRGNSSRF
jgi:hypothetical protein